MPGLQAGAGVALTVQRLTLVERGRLPMTCWRRDPSAVFSATSATDMPSWVSVSLPKAESADPASNWRLTNSVIADPGANALGAPVQVVKGNGLFEGPCAAGRAGRPLPRRSIFAGVRMPVEQFDARTQFVLAKHVADD